MTLSRKLYKPNFCNNPISPNIFCADPTAIEYKGRLYVYGTNDQQQYEEVGDFGKNTYEKIKSLVCFSTDDMVNWTYHGIIDVEKIAPWSLTSWAPALMYRTESDGLDHFYLYFSNSGCGVGVLTATSPLGPWSSPLNSPLVNMNMKGIEELTNPFDPGCCVDSKGDGWLVFGGGIAEGYTEDFPGTVRIVKLGKDFISFDSDFVQIDAPYFFEASSLNFINDSYVYSFNSNWNERKIWNYEAEKSTQCSMNYMYTKTPLIADSWKYGGNFFKNPGDQGLNYSNNHTHFVKFKDQYYLFYHTLTLQEDMQTNGGFRSICVDKIPLNENPLDIKMCNGSRNGVTQIKNLDGFSSVSGNTMCTSADISFEYDTEKNVIGSKSMESGAWFSVKGVDFGQKAVGILLDVMAAENESFMELHLDRLGNPSVATIKILGNQVEVQFTEEISGVHTLFFVFGNKDIVLKSWQLK